MQDTDYGVTDHSFSVWLRRDFNRRTPKTAGTPTRAGILKQQEHQQQNEQMVDSRHIRNRRDDNSRTPVTTELHNIMNAKNGRLQKSGHQTEFFNF
jgi:hypothetical protein